MQHFKEFTLGKVIVYMRKTLESFPGNESLAQRTNVILSHKADIDGRINVRSIEEILDLAKTQDIYIIGGASLYNQMLPYYDKIVLTQVYANKNADTFFHNLIKTS